MARQGPGPQARSLQAELRDAEEQLAKLDGRLAELQSLLTADAAWVAGDRLVLEDATQHVVVARIRLDALRSTLRTAADET